MAEISKFFNSAPGDPRTYQASDFADYFGSVLSTGLLHTDNIPALEVKCDGTDLRTYVTPGKAIIQGYLYENTSNLYLDHALPEPTLDRIDRIVLRLDKRNQSRYIRLFVKQGTPSENPVPPDLQRDDFIYELSLAQIRVRANTSTLNPADLIDERLDENLCGLVHSLISIPTSQFQAQWDLYFNAKKDEIDAETLNYLQQLASNITSFEQEWDTWFSGIQNEGFASAEKFNAHLADTASKFTNINLNIIDMAVELETLKGATLNGVTANIFIETFQNLNDINLMNGIYDSTNKRLVL
ncbi:MULTISPECIES: phage tail protein [unclassified Geobacillus]|uniref:phage tail protein n=1 Tax=unclassified Geobacillus TaxID=2642459 RepID=UPI000D3776D4|nr:MULTISPECIES: phage tail protein [unclassified Geobacillus]PUF85658.1 phage tail protein [Geobacillus sp. LYN3]TXK89074.1 phage tail protein [Geobacillus sp. AYS3]